MLWQYGMTFILIPPPLQKKGGGEREEDEGNLVLNPASYTDLRCRIGQTVLLLGLGRSVFLHMGVGLVGWGAVRCVPFFTISLQGTI